MRSGNSRRLPFARFADLMEGLQVKTGRERSRVRAAALLVLCGLLSGCMGPEVMIATNIASAALKAGVEYAEKNKPTPEQAWRAAKRGHLEARGEAGDKDAQFALARLYQRREHGTAQYWMCEAANSGHPQARMQLGHWYNEDRLSEDPWPYIGIRPDNRQAYLWYRLAEASGEPGGALFSGRLAGSGLTEPELRAAREMVEAWTPGGCGYSPVLGTELAQADQAAQGE